MAGMMTGGRRWCQTRGRRPDRTPTNGAVDAVTAPFAPRHRRSSMAAGAPDATRQPVESTLAGPTVAVEAGAVRTSRRRWRIVALVAASILLATTAAAAVAIN